MVVFQALCHRCGMRDVDPGVQIQLYKLERFATRSRGLPAFTVEALVSMGLVQPNLYLSLSHPQILPHQPLRIELEGIPLIHVALN